MRSLKEKMKRKKKRDEVGKVEENGATDGPTEERLRGEVRKRKKRAKTDEAEEAALAAAVFGTSTTEWADRAMKGTEWGELQERDEAEDEATSAPEADNRLPRDPEEALLPAAWVDEDDEEVVVDLVASKRLRKLRGAVGETAVSGVELERRLRERFASGREAAWARADGESKKSALEKLTQKSGRLVDERESRLEVLRCPDANARAPSSAAVQSVEFSGDATNLMLTAGMDKYVRIFQVDGDRNAQRSGLFCRDMPVFCAAFVGRRSGALKIAASGRRPFFYLFDLETSRPQRVESRDRSLDKSLERFAASSDGALLAFCANRGRVSVCDARAGLWTHDLHLNGTTRTVAFDNDDSLKLYAAGSDADVYAWDLRHSRRCLAKIPDPGRSVTSSLAVKGDLLAVGSEAGVVNLFRDHLHLKTLKNLTTPITRLAFSDQDFLAFSSKWAKDALRVVNLRGLQPTVYANWPTSKTPLHYVSALAFSSHHHYFAIGNDRGRVLLYDLQRPPH